MKKTINATVLRMNYVNERISRPATTYRSIWRRFFRLDVPLQFKLELKKSIPILAMLLVLTGCAVISPNIALPNGKANIERRTIDLGDPNRPIILLAFSGGGSRAAMLAWTILLELRSLEYENHGIKRRLIDDVTVISSVSGGSVIAAYFGLYGAEKLDDFEHAFLEKNNMLALTGRILNPILLLGSVVGEQSRFNALTSFFDQQDLFNGRTFADLNQSGKPFIVINSTDIAGGEIFSFMPRRFDDICSDLDSLPISIGVSASAAVPILISSVALKNHSGEACGNKPPEWVDMRLRSSFGRFINLDSTISAQYMEDLRRGDLKKRDIQYIHLLDGGLSDNLGARSLVDAITNINSGIPLLYWLNTAKTKRLVTIIVNARSDPPSSLYTKESAGILDAIESVTRIPIDSMTSAGRRDIAMLSLELRGIRDLTAYNVLVDFDRLSPVNDLERDLRERSKQVPTSWNISGSDRITIRQAGLLLLHRDPCFQHLLIDMKISADYIDKHFSETGCPTQAK